MRGVMRWTTLGLGALLTLYSGQAFIRLEAAMNEFGGTIWNWDMFYYHPIRMVFVPVSGLVLLAVAAMLFLRRGEAD
jgi:hypothetical protein